MRKIFVLKQVTQLPATNVDGRKIQRILIFDNHPDSVRLVSLHHLTGDVQRASPRPLHQDVILGLFLILLLIAAMFWPLLLLS